MKKLMATLGLGAALAFSAPTVAEAQGPVVTGGLVNVTIVDAVDVVIRDVNVGVAAALGIAANVCGVTVNVLAAQLGRRGPIECTNTVTGQRAVIRQA